MKTYLGDGVYAEFDGWMATIATEDGISKTNIIYMEPEVRKSLMEFFKTIDQDKRVVPGKEPVAK